MFKNILGTIGTRLINAVLAFVVVILTTRYLGAANYGTISLIILAVAIIQLFNNFVAGGALIYMAPRAGAFKLLLPAYIWTVLITLASTGLLHFMAIIFPLVEVIPEGYLFHILFLAMLMSFVSVNCMLLLGLEKVNSFNLLNLLQVVTLVVILLTCYFVLDFREVKAYFWALFFSYLTSFIVSMILLFPLLKPQPLTGMKQLLAEIFRFGTYIQFANIFQQLNYRLSFYIVDAFIGRSAVGVLAAGVQMAEGLWLIARSISMVLFSRISNQMDDVYSVKLTLTMTKITWIVTMVALVLLLLVPTSVFETLFGIDFAGIRPVIASLGIGIVTLSVSMIFSGFFAGYNRPYHNTISSAIGLVFTFTLGLILIPMYGIIGAGITATVSYTAASAYQFIIFSRIAHLGPRDFMLTRSEIALLVTEVRKIVAKPTHS
jgi:O-antigen/teichoic acid export membrane protein